MLKRATCPDCGYRIRPRDLSLLGATETYPRVGPFRCPQCGRPLQRRKGVLRRNQLILVPLLLAVFFAPAYIVRLRPYTLFVVAAFFALLFALWLLSPYYSPVEAAESRGHEWEKEKRSEDEEPEEKERGEET